MTPGSVLRTVPRHRRGSNHELRDGDPDGSPSSARPTRLRIGTYLVATIVTWTVVSLGLWSVLPMAFGLQPTLVVSGSMSPAIDAGDVVFVDTDPAPALLVPGSIITYADPAVGLVTTHRIIGIDDAGATFVTKGDANSTADSSPVPAEAVHGSARFVVPSSGLLRLWYSQGNYVAVVAALVVVLGSSYIALGTNPFGQPDSPIRPGAAVPTL